MAERTHPWFPKEWMAYYGRKRGRRITNRQLVEASEGKFTEPQISELLNDKRVDLSVADVEAVAAALSVQPGVTPLEFVELFMSPEKALAVRPFMARADLLVELSDDDVKAVIGYIEGKVLEKSKAA